LYYAKDFDPNTRQYITHVQDVDKVELPGLLMELSQLYFDQLGSEKEEKVKVELKKETKELEVYQCQDCFTVYDETFGDITQNIAPATLFNKLSETYKCSLCEAPITNFKKKILVK
jgi:rubredoxin